MGSNIIATVGEGAVEEIEPRRCVGADYDIIMQTLYTHHNQLNYACYGVAFFYQIDYLTNCLCKHTRTDVRSQLRVP